MMNSLLFYVCLHLCEAISIFPQADGTIVIGHVTSAVVIGNQSLYTMANVRLYLHKSLCDQKKPNVRLLIFLLWDHGGSKKVANSKQECWGRAAMSLHLERPDPHTCGSMSRVDNITFQ